MRFRPHVILAFVRKDGVRLLRNGPALMLVGLFVVVAFLVGSSGLVAREPQAEQVAVGPPENWIVYSEDNDWVKFLKARAPEELRLRFFEASEVEASGYPPNVCVIELLPQAFDRDRMQLRRIVQYRYPGSDPNVLWPASRWLLSVSMEHLGKVPQLFETVQPLTPPSQEDGARRALEELSVADLLNRSLVGTALLTTVLFFTACGLMVSLTAQERERGALRAMLLTPASYVEFVLAKILVHGGLALGTSTLVMLALQPAVLSSLLFWATLVVLTGGYFAVGLLIASFAKNQAAPNLLSFAYLMLIGALNLLGQRFDAFQFLSSLTFERYGLVLTTTSLNFPDLSVAESLDALRSTEFRMLFLIVGGLLMLSTFVGSRRMLRD